MVVTTTQTVALRTGDAGLVEEVRRLTELVGAELAVVTPGAPAPPATLLLDDGVGPGRWTAPTGGPPLVLVHGPGAAGPGAAAPGLSLPAQAHELVALMSAGRERARTVGVLGATGGAGASVLAAALARAAVTAGTATALVDLDPAGGGVDVLLGIEHDPGPRWADLDPAEPAFLPPRLAVSLPSWRGARVLSGDLRGGVPARSPVAARAVSALAQHHDLVVLDLPRDVLAEATAPVEVLTRCEVVLLLASCDVRSVSAVLTAARVLRSRRTSAQLVVRRRDAAAAEAEELARASELPLAGVLREERSFRAGLERGITPGDQRRGPVLSLARDLLARLELGR